jgi:hypothetical protein
MFSTKAFFDELELIKRAGLGTALAKGALVGGGVGALTAEEGKKLRGALRGAAVGAGAVGGTRAAAGLMSRGAGPTARFLRNVRATAGLPKAIGRESRRELAKEVGAAPARRAAYKALGGLLGGGASGAYLGSKLVPARRDQ